jgi:hypothetical protein
MNNQPKRLIPLISILAGAVLGFLGGPVQVLIIWALAGLLLGFISGTRRIAISSGIIFGFIVSFMFMLTGYSGEAPFYTHFLPFGALGVFGGICGLILAMVGYLLKRLNKKTR